MFFLQTAVLLNKTAAKRQKHQYSGVDRECDGVVIAAPEQQGWQSAAGGRRDGGWCTCNSNSSDCQEEESPERVAHWEDRRRIRRRETARGRQTAGRIREENKMRRDPQRLAKREAGRYWLVTEDTAQECETCERPFLRITATYL